MKTFLLSLILFHFAISANVLFAQPLRGVIDGLVTDDKGVPTAGATISIKRQGLNDYNLIDTIFTDDKGKFTAHVEAGVYVVKAKYRCQSSRVDNFEVPAGKTSAFNIELLNEDCDQKEAEKMIEWKACQQEMSVVGLQITEADKAEIINQILAELFKFEDPFLRDNYQEITFSTENIDAAWIKPFPGIKASFLSPQKLQAKADSSQEGKFSYYAFSNWQVGSSCAFVGISIETAVSKIKSERKEPDVFYCPVGSSKGYLFRKESGKWKFR